MLQGRGFQAAWNLLFLSIIAISVAATLNGSSVWGNWINFATIGIADTGFTGPDILGASDDFLDNRSTDTNQRRGMELYGQPKLRCQILGLSSPPKLTILLDLDSEPNNLIINERD